MSRDQIFGGGSSVCDGADERLTTERNEHTEIRTIRRGHFSVAGDLGG